MAARQDMTTAFYRLYYSGVSIMINHTAITADDILPDSQMVRPPGVVGSETWLKTVATRQKATLSGTVVLEHFQTVSVVDGHCYISAVWLFFVVHHTDNTGTHT